MAQGLPCSWRAGTAEAHCRSCRAMILHREACRRVEGAPSINDHAELLGQCIGNRGWGNGILSKMRMQYQRGGGG